MESCSCNVCESNDFDVVRMDQWSSPESQLWYPVITCLCRQCGHVYNNPRLSAGEIRDFYARQKRETFQTSRGESKGLNAADVAHLTDIAGEGKHRQALEIGCYTGYLAARLRAAGWSVEGLEPNQVSAEAARERHDLVVHQCIFEDFQTDKKFDLLFLGGVLEHVRDPCAFLLKMNRHLRTGGLAYIRVPNLEDLGYDTAAELFILEHLHNFSASTLGMLFEKTGFRPLSFHVHDRFPRSFVAIGQKHVDQSAAGPFSLDNQYSRVSEEIRRYSERIDNLRAMLNQRFQSLAEEAPSPRIAIYGAGDHTGLLLRHTLLGKLNVVSILDGNPQKQGTQAFGMKVLDPNRFDTASTDIVIISSRAFQEEIYHRIRHWEDEGLRIMKLYDLSQSRYDHE